MWQKEAGEHPASPPLPFLWCSQLLGSYDQFLEAPKSKMLPAPWWRLLSKGFAARGGDNEEVCIGSVAWRNHLAASRVKLYNLWDVICHSA